jgi:hypothetical protein
MDDSEPPHETSRSPNGSQASQTSSQLNLLRVVKLLPESARQDNGNNNNNNHDDWMIRAEFYDEDIVAEDAEMAHPSDEEEDDMNELYEPVEQDDDDYDDVDDFDDEDMIWDSSSRHM